MDLADIQKTSHKIAQDHGFWSTEEDRNIPSKLALIHEEVSEALGEYREGRMKLYYSAHRDLYQTEVVRKPEGFGIELADAIIRIGDLAEYLGIDLNEMVRLKFEYNINRPFKHGRRV